MDENKKSIWYKIGKALKGSNIPSDQEVLIADPTAQLGYNIGTILVDFLSKLNSGELNELFDGTPVVADPTAQLGYLLGEGLAQGVTIMKAAYNEVEETPDTIDAANEARAAEVSKADAVTKGFRYQRREDLQRQREGTREKTPQELQDEAYAQYKKDGNLDSYLDRIAEIDADIDLGALSIYQRGQLADGLTYYGLGDDPFLESYRASAGDSDIRPLFNYGIADTFLENIAPERVIDYQIALVNSGFLAPGSYNPGQYDEETIKAVEAAFTYMNPKSEFGISQQDLFDIASATQGNNNAFLGFVRDFFLDGLDDIEFTDTIAAYSRASIIPLPSSEFLLQQISTQGKNYLGVPLNQFDLQAAEAFARGEISRLTKIQNEAQLQYENQLRQAEADMLRREKLGLPSKDYYIEAPPSGEQITQALGYGVDSWMGDNFGDLADTETKDAAYRQGLGRIINAFSAGR